VKELKEKTEIVLNPEISKWRTDASVDHDLLKDIKDRGLIEDITARRLPSGKVELISGHRRYAALIAKGVKPEDIMKDVKVLENVSDEDAVLMAISANRFRKDLQPVEEARAFKTLAKIGLMPDQIALKAKRSESYVRERLNLLDLPSKVIDKMEKHEIEIGYAEPLKKLEGYETIQLQMIDSILKGRKREWDGITSIEKAEEFVQESLKKVHHAEELVNKYGPCPKCGSGHITDDWEKDKLKCYSCKYVWNAKTKEPWELWELREKAKDMGLKLDIKGNKGELTPVDQTKIVQEAMDELKKDKSNIPKTLRSSHEVNEILSPLLKGISHFRIEGDNIRINLIEDTGLRFTARQKTYRTGEKTAITQMDAGWGSEEKPDENKKRVKKYIDSLDVPE